MKLGDVLATAWSGDDIGRILDCVFSKMPLSPSRIFLTTVIENNSPHLPRALQLVDFKSALMKQPLGAAQEYPIKQEE